MACAIQFGEFGHWSVQCAAFEELLVRAGRNTEDNAVQDLLGFARVCGLLNVFRYSEGDIRQGIVFALRLAAQQWVVELSVRPDVPTGTIESIQRLIAITNTALNEANHEG